MPAAPGATEWKSQEEGREDEQIEFSWVGETARHMGTVVHAWLHRVDFFGTYPGLYVPTPRRLRIASADQSVEVLATEILALSKLNWNKTQFDGSEPITLNAARHVGEILKYVPDGDPIKTRYSHYM
jgi:hypothetical protein